MKHYCTQHNRVPTPHVGAPGARETTLPPWRLLAGLSAARVRSRLGDAASAGHDSHRRERQSRRETTIRPDYTQLRNGLTTIFGGYNNSQFSSLNDNSALGNLLLYLKYSKPLLSTRRCEVTDLTRIASHGTVLH